MAFFSQQIPVKFPCLAPLLELSEILSHKQKLLARMSEHEGISGFQVFKLIVIQSRHLVDHRAFQMNYFIMRQHQHIFFTECIGHGESHLVMIVFAVNRIQFHIFQEIMHPSHVPFKCKSKTVFFFHISGHFRPCSRLFCDHHNAFISSLHQSIQMFEEFNGFQILIAAVLVGNPLSVSLAVIKIQHGSNRIHTKSVHMEFFHPVQCVGQ